MLPNVLLHFDVLSYLSFLSISVSHSAVRILASQHKTSELWSLQEEWGNNEVNGYISFYIPRTTKGNCREINF